MSVIHTILLVFALVLFVLSAWRNPPASDPVRLIGAGLAFLTASMFL